ncbi:MAG: DUF2752 domain-containing protein [Anaerococcus sp.]|nr:hypothetical protein HMPREF3224_01178 [Anaerococcus hydrogenalis]MDU2829947.1 DUF2752 domain-containing protein [Anaerococcus sp.]
MRKKLKDLIYFMLAIVIFYGLLFFFGFTCPIKALTGVSCPGCGMTRAYISIFKLNPRLAFYYHPLFPLPALIFLMYLFEDRIPQRVKKIGIILVIGLFFLVYIVRMINPEDNIVVFRPKDSIIYMVYKEINEEVRKR